MLIDYILVLLLSAASFYAGKRVSDSYNQTVIEELRYQIRVSAAQHGVGYIAPPKRVPIGQPFMDKLKQNGRATQKITFK